MVRKINVELTGIQPLLMKSAVGIDPTHPLTKAIKKITAKGRKKTDADLERLDRLEYESGLYINDAGPYIPDVNVLGTLREGAAVSRQGKAIQAGVAIEETDIPLLYTGPRTVDDLYDQRFADRRPIKNLGGGGRVMRVRPRFNAWALKFTLLVDDALISVEDARASLEMAGLRKGLGDFRPRFGRFEVTGWKAA